VQPLDVGPRAASILDPGGELCECRFFREASGRCADARRNPIGEGDLLGHMTSRTRVGFAHLRKMIRSKPSSRADKSRPHPPMDKSDFALDEATHEDFVAVTDCSRHRENLVTLRMRPPATPYWLSSYRCSERWNRPLRGLEYDTVFANESESPGVESSPRSVGPTTAHRLPGPARGWQSRAETVGRAVTASCACWAAAVQGEHSHGS
jgi:hypothetical protein